MNEIDSCASVFKKWKVIAWKSKPNIENRIDSDTFKNVLNGKKLVNSKANDKTT